MTLGTTHGAAAALRAALALALVARAAALVPVWSQFRATAQHTGAATTVGPPSSRTDAWSLQSPDGSSVAASSPAVASDGTVVFVTAAGMVVAVRPYSAAPAWTASMPAQPTQAEGTPAISATGDFVFVAANTYLYCYSMTSGALTYSFNTATYGYGAFTFSPTVGSQYIAIPTTSRLLVLYATLALYQQFSAYAPSSPVASIDNDSPYGYCTFFSSTPSYAIKWCPSYSPSTPVWTFQLPEPSTLSPVIVQSINAVFFVTNGPNAFIYGFVLQGTTNTPYCTINGQFSTTISSSPAWVGGSFGLAAVSSAAVASPVMLTGALPSSSCTLTTSILGAAPSAGSSLAIDGNLTGFYGASDGRLFALNLRGLTPEVAWTAPLLGGVGALRSSPAVGPNANVVLGIQSDAGLPFILSLQPICGAGFFQSLGSARHAPSAPTSPPRTSRHGPARTALPAATRRVPAAARRSPRAGPAPRAPPAPGSAAHARFAAWAAIPLPVQQTARCARLARPRAP